MDLMIGGSYQGKLDYVLHNYHLLTEDVYDCYNLLTLNKQSAISIITSSESELFKKPIINHFHILIKVLLELSITPFEVIDRLINTNKNTIIISDEIGYGIVPMAPEERLYRETTGRILCNLVKRANRVDRIVCGIGTTIKKEKP